VRTLESVYRACITMLWDQFHRDRIEAARATPDYPDSAQFLRIYRSADHAADP
jgi:hypothetical protein